MLTSLWSGGKYEARTEAVKGSLSVQRLTHDYFGGAQRLP